MSNEELAALAYNGDNEALGSLYLNCYKFICREVKRYYHTHQKRLIACGVEFEDMVNEAYFAVQAAVKAFNEQETEYSFITFLSYPLLNCFNTIAGKRTKQSKKEPLNAYLSLDAPISDTDDLTFADTVEDKNALTEDEITENITLLDVFPAAKQELSDIEYDIIELKYKGGMTHENIAQLKDSTVNDINTHQRRAIRKLRKSKRLRELATDIIDVSYSKGGLYRFENTGTSSVEWAVLRMEKERYNVCFEDNNGQIMDSL